MPPEASPASQLFVAEVTGESRFDAAGLIERVYVLDRQGEFQACKIILKLPKLPRPKYRDHRNGPPSRSQATFPRKHSNLQEIIWKPCPNNSSGG